MNTAKLKALRERYSPQPAPKCHICGAEMTAQRMSASRITYGCTGATYGDAGCHYAPGRNFADEHYEQSQVTVVDLHDPEVLDLIAALEAAEKRGADMEVACELFAESKLAQIKLESALGIAQQRLAELESQRKLAFSACNRWADKCREAEKRVAELERQAIQPLPIGELINRLEEQTGEPWGEVYLAGINFERGR